MASKFGLYVYVKEHYVQRHRPISFYEDLCKIKNVRLIKSNVPSASIMINSLAVATQTGTCVLEASLMGKPSIVFGQGVAWKKLPGLFEMKDEQQGSDILKMILEGININIFDVKRYFYSIQNRTIASLPASAQAEYLSNMRKGVDKSECLINDRVQLIISYIEKVYEC